LVGTPLLEMILFFFFFQAEDGIRDKLVTGVQTCALPISKLAAVQGRHAPVDEGDELGVDEAGGVETSPHGADAAEDRRAPRVERSEERRVGKECRCRGSPYE